MKNLTLKTITSATLVAMLSMVAIPTFATPVFAEGGLTCEVKLNPDGSTYTECTNTGEYIADPTTNEHFQETVQQTQQTWEQETGYTYGVNVNEQTPAPVHTCQDDGYSSDYYWSESKGACVTDYVAPTPVATPAPTPVTSTPKPTATPTATPETTVAPTAATWNYSKVSTSLLSLINTQRTTLGLSPLTLVTSAVVDATQRATESMEYAKEVTAYGTATDAHRGFDTEWGANEAQGFVDRLTGEETEEEVANAIFSTLTTGVTKNDAIFSGKYTETALGFTDAFFTRRSGSTLGYNVYFNILLNK